MSYRHSYSPQLVLPEDHLRDQPELHQSHLHKRYVRWLSNSNLSWQLFNSHLTFLYVLSSFVFTAADCQSNLWGMVTQPIVSIWLVFDAPSPVLYLHPKHSHLTAQPLRCVCIYQLLCNFSVAICNPVLHLFESFTIAHFWAKSEAIKATLKATHPTANKWATTYWVANGLSNTETNLCWERRFQSMHCHWYEWICLQCRYK